VVLELIPSAHSGHRRPTVSPVQDVLQVRWKKREKRSIVHTGSREVRSTGRVFEVLLRLGLEQEVIRPLFRHQRDEWMVWQVHLAWVFSYEAERHDGEGVAVNRAVTARPDICRPDPVFWLPACRTASSDPTRRG